LESPVTGLPDLVAIAVIAVAGLAVGSFLNVVIHRLPATMDGESPNGYGLLQPRSVAPFGTSIVRLGETVVDFMPPAPAEAYAAGMSAYQRGDHAGALAAWLPLAERGHGDAAAGLGTMHINGEGVAMDVARAAHWFAVAAAAGHALAQLNLAIMHFNGQGVAKDAAMATTLAKQAAAALPAGRARDIAVQLCAAAA